MSHHFDVSQRSRYVRLVDYESEVSGRMRGDELSSGEFSAPIMGTRICAGFPSPADDYVEGEIDVVRMLMPNRPASFFWRVSGKSMIAAGVHDGDLVVVDRSLSPKNGNVVVAVIDGEVSLKLYHDGNPPRLTFANPDLPAFVLGEGADVAIWGVVTWSLHKPGEK